MDKAYADTARLLLAVAPEVFRGDIFAMKGGTGAYPAGGFRDSSRETGATAGSGLTAAPTVPMTRHGAPWHVMDPRGTID